VIRVIYRKKGFTLIEIMIVISIISLLSIILVPKVGAVRVESKNNKVSTNVLLVRTYLDNRSGKDSIKIGDKNDSTTLSNIVNSILGDMNSNFSGSNALENPFNGSEKILSQGEIKENAPSKNASVLIYYSTGALPASSDITKSNSFPKGEDIKGSTVVVVYGNKGGYALYGVDNYGNIISPYIIKFPPSLADMELSDDNQGNDDEQDYAYDSDRDIADIFYKNCLNIFGDTSSNISLGNSGSGSMDITGSVYLQGNSVSIMQNSTDISQNLNIVGVNSSSNVNLGNGNNDNLNVSGTCNIQGNDIYINENSSTNNFYINGTGDITFANSSINTKFDGGTAQIESRGDIKFQNNIVAQNTRFSAIAGGNIVFDNVDKELSVDDESSAYIEAGEDIIFDYKINTNAPISMISNYGSIIFNNNGKQVNIDANAYLSAKNGIKKYRTITTSNLVDEPISPAVRPNLISNINKLKSIKNLKTGITYNTSDNPYDQSDSDIDVSVIKGSDTSALKQVFNNSIDPDKYKFVIINGDCTINGDISDNDNLILDKFIIYCTGKMDFSNNSNFNNVTLTNSSIIAKDINTKLKSTLTMTSLDSNQYTDEVKDKINKAFYKYVKN
jgi:prepilin-type N-terminal cleavage/methylation domain-containing protein